MKNSARKNSSEPRSYQEDKTPKRKSSQTRTSKNLQNKFFYYQECGKERVYWTTKDKIHQLNTSQKNEQSKGGWTNLIEI